MSGLTRARRWRAVEAVWCETADLAARHALGALPWQALGGCGARADLPWTGDPEQVGPWDAESMRAVCGSCPVLADCAGYVERANVVAGWWAGAHRDPAYVAPPAPTWVPIPVAGRTLDAAAWQGVLPLDGVA